MSPLECGQLDFEIGEHKLEILLDATALGYARYQPQTKLVKVVGTLLSVLELVLFGSIGTTVLLAR